MAEIVSQVDPVKAEETLDLLRAMLQEAEDEKLQLNENKEKADAAYEVAKEALDQANETLSFAIQSEETAKAALEVATINKEAAEADKYAAEICEASATTHLEDTTDLLEHRLPIVENDIVWLNSTIKYIESSLARHWAVVGNTIYWERAGEEDSKLPECLEDYAGNSVGKNVYGNNIGVQCCSLDGKTGSRPGCIESVDWSSAKAHCEMNDLRLCTAAEVTSNIGAGTGCGFDKYLVWTSDECNVA